MQQKKATKPKRTPEETHDAAREFHEAVRIHPVSLLMEAIPLAFIGGLWQKIGEYHFRELLGEPHTSTVHRRQIDVLHEWHRMSVCILLHLAYLHITRIPTHIRETLPLKGKWKGVDRVTACDSGSCVAADEGKICAAGTSGSKNKDWVCKNKKWVETPTVTSCSNKEDNCSKDDEGKICKKDGQDYYACSKAVKQNPSHRDVVNNAWKKPADDEISRSMERSFMMFYCLVFCWVLLYNITINSCASADKVAWEGPGCSGTSTSGHFFEQLQLLTFPPIAAIFFTVIVEHPRRNADDHIAMFLALAFFFRFSQTHHIGQLCRDAAGKSSLSSNSHKSDSKTMETSGGNMLFKAQHTKINKSKLHAEVQKNKTTTSGY